MKEPTVGPYLDDEEKELIEQIERDADKFVSIMTPEMLAEHREAARATLNEARIKISLRVREFDLRRLKARALREGIPYQTLINSILHKAVSGEKG